MPSQDHAYALIGIDQMEAAVVRRRLMDLPEQGAGALVSQLQRKGLLADARIRHPLYETNVWPLYYYWSNKPGLEHRDVYDKTIETVQKHFKGVPQHLVPMIESFADTEVDILIEDEDYFVFIEAKEVAAGRAARFGRNKEGVHQLVRQQLQGEILEKLIDKRFALATIGANQGKPVPVVTGDADRELLELFDWTQQLTVVDLEWPG